MEGMYNRFIARIVIEAATPLALGSGDKSLTTDRLIARDMSGLPYIPGTSISGVLRHAFISESESDKSDVNEWEEIFGYQKSNKEKEGQGSRLIVSSAYFIGKGNQVFEGLNQPDWNDPFYKAYLNLPVRDHVRIEHTGTAKNGAKFDEEVVLKGTRFVFEIELVGSIDDAKKWKNLLMTLSRSDFRLGGGTRKGFGELKIISINHVCYDLTQINDRTAYLEKSSSLKAEFIGEIFNETPDITDFIEYKLLLKPDSFFLFGAGEGSDNADMIPMTEQSVIWNDNGPQLQDDQVVIPGTSVKGAISHRVAYHFNKDHEVTANLLIDKNRNDLIQRIIHLGYHLAKMENFDSCNKTHLIKLLTEYNPAVVDLFGYSLQSEDEKCVSITNSEDNKPNIGKLRGKVMISDVFESSTGRKVLNHVSIDRFTGGAIDGVLFCEEVATMPKDKSVEIIVVVEKDIKKESLSALEDTLKDIASGQLPLGGGVMRGNGCFTGKIFKNGEALV